MDAIYYKGGVIRPVVALVKSIALALPSVPALGRTRRADHPDRLSARIDLRADYQTIARSTHHTCGGGRGGRHSRDVQHSTGRCFVCHRVDVAGSQRQYLSPGRHRDGRRHFSWAAFLRSRPGIPCAKSTPLPDNPARAHSFCCSYCSGYAHWHRRGGLHPRADLAEDVFDKVPGRYTRHLLGMLLVGILIYLLYAIGHYYIEGVGYATIEAILGGQPLSRLAASLGLQARSTSTTLGSGASGGIFSPSLYMGATFGGAFGIVLSEVMQIPVNVPALPWLAWGLSSEERPARRWLPTMIFEMTLDYDIVVPMICAVGASLASDACFRVRASIPSS